MTALTEATEIIETTGALPPTVVEAVKTNLQREWERYRQGAMTRERFARSVTVIGGGRGVVRLPDGAVDHLYQLVAALRIPPKLHGVDLIQAMAFGKVIRFHVTVEGELAVAVQDPRLLLCIDVDTQVTPTDGGAFHTCTATVRYRGMEDPPGSGHYRPVAVSATDSVMVSNWQVFMAAMQQQAQAQAVAAMAESLAARLERWEGSRRGGRPMLLDHFATDAATNFLGQVQKKLNRHNQFLVRTCRTKAMMLALREARGRIAIVPMVEGRYELLNQVRIAGRAELISVLAGMKYDIADILDAAAVELGCYVSSVATIPDDEAICTAIYQRVLMA